MYFPETRSLGLPVLCINLSGGAVSIHKRSAEADQKCAGRFQPRLGADGGHSVPPVPPTPGGSGNRSAQSTIDPAGRRGGPPFPRSNEAGRQAAQSPTVVPRSPPAVPRSKPHRLISLMESNLFPPLRQYRKAN